MGSIRRLQRIHGHLWNNHEFYYPPATLVEVAQYYLLALMAFDDDSVAECRREWEAFADCKVKVQSASDYEEGSHGKLFRWCLNTQKRPNQHP